MKNFSRSAKMPIKNEKIINLFVFFTFFTFSFQNTGISAFDILFPFLFLITVFLNSKLVIKKTVLFVLCAFIIITTIPLIWVQDFYAGLSYGIINIYVIIIPVMTLLVFNDEKYSRKTLLSTAIQSWLFGTLISLMASILTYAKILPLAELLLWENRIKGFFSDPNVFAPFIVPLVLYVTSLRKKISKITFFSYLVILYLGIILCFSRAAWLNTIFSLLIFLSFDFKEYIFKTNAFKVIKMLLYLIFILLISILLYNSLGVNDMLLERSAYQDYDNERFAIQKVAFDTFLDNIFGIGPGQTEIYFSYATHSTYIRVLVEYGILGALLYIFIIILALYSSYIKSLRKSIFHRIAFSCLLGLMINGFVVDTLHWRHFWVILGFCFIKNPKDL